MLEIERAEGCYQYDVLGKKYLDLISGIAVANIGHQHPVVNKALKAQIDKHSHVMVYGEFVQSPQVEYAEWLAGQLPQDLNCTYFTNSGAEAIEAAMKLAKRLTGRSKIISCLNAYHGSTQGALSIAGGEELKAAFRPLLPKCEQIPYNNIAALEAIDTDTACFVVEPIQGEKGAFVPDEHYMQAVKARCLETGTLLVLDEIQTGFGRTGKPFAFEWSHVIPDILVLGKALGGGLPLGAVVTSTERMAAFKNDPILGHITTFGGHPLSCAAGLAANKWLFDSGLILEVSRKEQLIKEALSPFKVNGIGLLLSIQLEGFEQVHSACKQLVNNGFITDWFLFNINAVRLAPPLIITDNELLEFAQAFRELRF
ncbi:MAG: aspartate aminotransferase family protein [Bacteroidetes bacterium]|nr:aspartate aminotransferase family protein [Bacteroidota bacterium]